MHPVVGAFGFDTDDAALRAEGAGNGGAAGKQPAAAERDDEGIEGAIVFPQFEGDRALPGHHMGVVEGLNDGEAAAFPGDPGHGLIGRCLLAVELHDFGAVAFRGVALGTGGVGGHADNGWNAEELRSQRNALGVVAR